MRVDEKLWDKGWCFAIIATVFGMSLTQAPPLNVAHKMLSDLNKKETAEQKRSSLQEPFHSIICRAGGKKRKGSG